MISCYNLAETFKKNNLIFFTGIPDSIFKSWMSFLENDKSLTNRVVCNECEAIALTTGYYLSTKNIGIVYMQNSGLGKTINPLTSLTSKEVYGIPLILMIGWRGEPGIDDEPQHEMMGRIMLSQLDLLEIPYKILPKNIEQMGKIVKWAKKNAEQNNSASAIIIKKNTLEKYISENSYKTIYDMSREDAIKIIIDRLKGEEAIISTTGKTSRELFEQRISREEISRDFLTLGSMGCSASIAVEIALQKPKKKIYCFDGDGAVLMQMGVLSTIGSYKPKNLIHVIFDNASYDSTGGQPTNSKNVDFALVAKDCGYNHTKTIETRKDLISSINDFRNLEGPNMLVIKINNGARENLGRPTSTPLEIKKTFIEFLEK